ncbi:UDP-glucose--hexose-1-phosphate uridylyltransferase [Paenibacillus oenotherae]|uniref:Galactose-1-phosphate uridylyltransferase n=1 Tax=Paenibacillus oenotherae TaxID=1435645 RepID=A0ABS7D9Z1_9BACL|nr:UDP-glucose--hexose-1-phosphate uridylyltransferase [Paenibacillus oenotherae]MBW7476764.1 UDP-glucose--hexose-1-phosphate uridylyltransferase [Paenibacillus oenotherae]
MTVQQRNYSNNEALILIERLLQFALQRGMIQPLDIYSSRNGLLDVFGFTERYEGEAAGEQPESVTELLEPLLDYGAAIGLIPANTATYRDLLDARIMGHLIPRPSEAAAGFLRTAEREGIARATDEFYQLSIDSNYIRMDRIRKNLYWEQPTDYGNLEITVNLSKPEKDPKEIALLRNTAPSNYPQCLLCADNIGYAGRADHPARQNLRVVPLELLDELWYFQYSPYVYYNEHSIIFRSEHTPMRISADTFARLLHFVDQFPHYFIGSNADLPIVGGSILGHDHFQAGRHVFPMEKAAVEAVYTDPSEPGVSFGIVAWPMSVLRVSGVSKSAVLRAAGRILEGWKEYSDPQAEIVAYTEQGGERIPHNTITPIARLRADGHYELDLVLRNNRTSREHPDGIFHPHEHLHHIKKENIGLIEVMGLAVLPGRLQAELEAIAAFLAGEASAERSELLNGPLHKHADWIEAMVGTHGTNLTTAEAVEVLRDEVGKKFLEVLKDSGVYKRTSAGSQAFGRLLRSLGLEAGKAG